MKRAERRATNDAAAPARSGGGTGFVHFKSRSPKATRYTAGAWRAWDSASAGGPRPQVSGEWPFDERFPRSPGARTAATVRLARQSSSTHHAASSCIIVLRTLARMRASSNRSTSPTSKHQTNCGGSLARLQEVEVRRRDRCCCHSRSLAPLLTCYRRAAPRLARRLVRASAIGRRPEGRCDRLRCATSASARPTRPTTRYRAHDLHAWHRSRVGQQGRAADRDRRDQVDFCSGALPVGAGRDVPRHAPPHVDAGAGRAMLLHCTVSLLLLLLLPIFVIRGTPVPTAAPAPSAPPTIGQSAGCRSWRSASSARAVAAS